MYQAQDMPTTLFIGDLSVTANEESLRNLFGSHNISLNFLKIMKNKSNNSLGYAFVSLESVDQAQYAINTLDGAYLCGRKLRVCFARQFEDLRSNSMSNPTNMNWPQQTSAPSNEHYDPRNSIYFKFLIPVDKASYATTDEGIVRSIFEQKYGPNTVVDVNIRRMAYDEVCF